MCVSVGETKAGGNEDEEEQRVQQDNKAQVTHNGKKGIKANIWPLMAGTESL